MMLHGEFLLLLALAAFYVYDSAALLYTNDFVLVARRNSIVLAKVSEIQLRGRYLFIPNPLTPHRPLFHLSWDPKKSLDTSAREQIAPLRHFIAALSVIRRWVLLLLLLLFVGLPALLFGYSTPVAILFLLGAVYLTILMTLIQVFRHRSVLELPNRVIASLAFEALACAPLALNLVRKISARRAIRQDAVRFARDVLPPEEVKQLWELLNDRINLKLDFIEPGEPMKDLEDFRRHVDHLLK